jgi:hypothetical protein
MLVAVDTVPDLPGHLDTEIQLALHGLASMDSAEAIRAMYAKEQPEFTGE